MLKNHSLGAINDYHARHNRSCMKLLLSPLSGSDKSALTVVFGAPLVYD
jgi:hypothetical protein